MKHQFLAKVIIVFTAAAIVSYAQTAASPTALAPNLYEFFFRHVAHLQAKDADITARNATPANLSAYYRKLAGLTQPQLVTLQTISQAALSDLAALDQQAQTIIVQWRAQMSAKISPGQSRPVPPAQLTAIQVQRAALLASYRNQLQAALGPAAFANLEQVRSKSSL